REALEDAASRIDVERIDDQRQEVAPEDLGRRVAQQLLGEAVPVRDRPLGIGGNDGGFHLIEQETLGRTASIVHAAVRRDAQPVPPGSVADYPPCRSGSGSSASSPGRCAPSIPSNLSSSSCTRRRSSVSSRPGVYASPSGRSRAST